MPDPITVPELAEWMSSHILNTFNEFVRVRSEGDSDMQYWCRGRIDAFLQILDAIDKEREAMVRAEWERVVSGHGFASEESGE